MIRQKKILSHTKGLALLPFFTFLVIKNILRRNAILSKETVLTICLSALLTIPIFLLSLPLLLLMFLIKKIVEVLIRQEDLNFDSMMTSTDTFWCTDNNKNSRGIINILVVVKSNSGGLEVYESFKESFPKAWKEHSKVHCTREKKYGYYYWRKQASYDADAFISKYDKYDSVSDWDKFMDEAAMSAMPLDGKATFQIIVGVKELKWRAAEDADAGATHYYPFMFRCHHSFGDGASVVNFLATQFCKDGVEYIKNYLDGFNYNVMKKLAKVHRKVNFIERIREAANADFKYLAFIDSFDNSFVASEKLKENFFLCYFSDHKQEITNKIDVIRRKYDLTFTKLMLALVEESLAQLYEEKIIVFPKEASNMLTCMTAMLKSLKIKDNISFSDDEHPVADLSNSFSLGLYKNSIKNPISSGVDPKTFVKHMLEKYKVIGEELDLLNKSIDYQFIKWIIDFICSSTPSFVISLMLDLHKNPFGMTNLPGLSEQLRLNNSNPKIQQFVVDFMFWVPQYKTTGLGLSLTKYCGNVEITFSSNCAYIEKRENAELFIKNILKNIDKLYETI